MEIRAQFRKVTGTMVNEPKTAVFLSTESKQVENIISDEHYFGRVTDYRMSRKNSNKEVCVLYRDGYTTT